ncbi:hypothetical protein [Rhizobium sp. PAMB 3182]
MQKPIQKLLCSTVAALFFAALPLSVLDGQPSVIKSALAKSEKSSGNSGNGGGGNSGGNGNSGGSSGKSGNSGSKSASASGKSSSTGSSSGGKSHATFQSLFSSAFSSDKKSQAKGKKANTTLVSTGTENGKSKQKGVKTAKLKLTGAIAAAHASATAFAHASPNSRLGKLKSYYELNGTYASLQDLADQTDATALQEAYDTLLGKVGQTTVDAYNAYLGDPDAKTLLDTYNSELAGTSLTEESFQSLRDAYEAAKASDPTVDPTAEQAYQDALTASNLTPEQFDTLNTAYTGLQSNTAYTDYQQALAASGVTERDITDLEQAGTDLKTAQDADQAAADAEAQAGDALMTANNGRPLTDEQKALLDATLAQKLGG